MGGFDERSYLGYQAELLGRDIGRVGGTVQQIDIDVTHFAAGPNGVGMSTVLFVCDPESRVELADQFAAEDFGVAEFDDVLRDPMMDLRLHWFVRNFIRFPTTAFEIARSTIASPQGGPDPSTRVLSVLPELMPQTRAEMLAMVAAIESMNALVQRAVDLSMDLAIR